MIWAHPRGQYPGFFIVGLWDYVAPKNVTSAPAYQNVTMTITHYLQYKTSVLMVPRPPKYQYFGTPKAAKR